MWKKSITIDSASAILDRKFIYTGIYKQETDVFYTAMFSCEELIHWKRLWCWEGLGAGGQRDDRGWDGWMASPTRWTWVWVNSRNWWWTGRTGMLQFMGSQRVGHDWATELNWTELMFYCVKKWKWKSLSHIRLFVTSRTIPSMEFSRPEHWSG